MKKKNSHIIRSFAGAVLFPAELYIKRIAGRSKTDPICVFIIGTPRSGTSLLYEFLVTHFRFSYISNLANRFSFSPLSVSWLFRNSIAEWTGDYTSGFGHIAGWGAPNEGGRAWNRWFPQNSYLDENYANLGMKKDLLNLIRGFSYVLDGPFLNKNVMHSVHLRLLDSLFTGCLFLVMKRSPIDNMRSIIDARERKKGPLRDQWWSVKPDIATKWLNADVATQAAVQIVGTHEHIKRDAEYLGADRFHEISYEELCVDPRSGLRAVNDFFSGHGISLSHKKVEKAVTEFKRTKKKVPHYSNEELSLIYEKISRVTK